MIPIIVVMSVFPVVIFFLCFAYLLCTNLGQLKWMNDIGNKTGKFESPLFYVLKISSST